MSARGVTGPSLYAALDLAAGLMLPRGREPAAVRMRGGGERAGGDREDPADRQGRGVPQRRSAAA